MTIIIFEEERMMLTFDGTNLKTVEQSIAHALGLTVQVFAREFTDYFVMHVNDLDNLSLEGFLEFLIHSNNKVDADSLRLNDVIFFHKTSVLDSGKSIKDGGLVNLREAIFQETPLKKYLESKGIRFSLDSGILSMDNNGERVIIERRKPAYSLRERVEADIHRRLLTDSCLNGYLFLAGALNRNDYPHIKHLPEFFFSINSLIPGLGDEWERSSTPLIVKSSVDIDWLDIVDDYSQQLNRNEKVHYIINLGLCLLSDSLRYGVSAHVV